MTEQPVETEQQFLGNETRLSDPIVQTITEPPFLTAVGEKAAAMIQPRQHYVPNAHLRRPAWSSVDDVQLAALARKSAHANKLAGIAKAQANKAEDALKLALEVEADAVLEAHNAEQALLTLVRKDSQL